MARRTHHHQDKDTTADSLTLRVSRGDIVILATDQFLRAIPRIISRVRASQATIRILITSHTTKDSTVKHHHQQKTISTLQISSHLTTRRKPLQSGIAHTAQEPLTTQQ